MTDESAETRLRDGFLGWQCRVRQHAMRQYGGRPSPGMRPRVTRLDGAEIAPAVTVLLIEAEPDETTAMCRHIVKRTHDPERRYQDALKLLSAAHFQSAGRFSDVLTALVAASAPLAAERACILEFEQFSQRWRLACAVAALDADDPAYQATYWHNHMFNPAIPAAIRVLALTPDWNESSATPPV